MAHNYRLTPTSRLELRKHADALLDRVLELRFSGFPLSREDVFEIMWGAEENQAWNILKNTDVYLAAYPEITIEVEDPTVPGLTAKLQVRLGDEYSHKHRSTGFPQFNGNTSPLRADPTRLPHEKRQAFYKWLAPAVEWKRKVQAARRVIEDFFVERAFDGGGAAYLDGGSLASVHARWQGFCVVPLSMDSPWPARMRAAPKDNFTRYYWPSGKHPAADWFAENCDRLEAVGAILSQGDMLSPRIADTGASMRGMIMGWKLPKKPG